jgi:hypothetical protein
MAFVVKDRIKETTTTTGTGTYTLAGAANGGYQTFADIGNANTTYYACTDGTDWEVGRGTYTASGTTLSRDEIIESSNSNNAVNWGSGSKDIFVTLPSSKALVMDDYDDFHIDFGSSLTFGADQPASSARMSLSINGSAGALGMSEPSFGTSTLTFTGQTLKGVGNDGDLHFMGHTVGGASRLRLYGGNTNVLTTNGDGSGVSITGALSVSGDLTVNGTTTTVNSTTVTIDDPVFTLGGDTAPTSDDNKDRGIEFRWHNGSAAKVGFFGYDDSEGKLTFIPDATNTSEVFSGTVGTILANLEGDVTGNADTASAADFLTGLADPNADRLLMWDDSAGAHKFVTLGSNLAFSGTTLNATDTNTTYSLASASTLGLVKIGYTENGKNYPVELDSEQMYVNVPWTDTTYSVATGSTAGLVKIGYTENGKNYPVELSSDQMYVNVPWTDTTYSAGTGLSLSGTTFTNTAPDQTVTLTGSGATSISGTYPSFTISSTDTTYTAGTGLSLSGTTFTNTAPDQTVALTGSGATSISGTYPNFTISSTDTNTTYSASTGLNLSGTTFSIDTSVVPQLNSNNEFDGSIYLQDDNEFGFYNSSNVAVGKLTFGGSNTSVMTLENNLQRIDIQGNGGVRLWYDNNGNTSSYGVEVFNLSTNVAGALNWNGTRKIQTNGSGVSVAGNLSVTGLVDGVDIATRDGVLTTTTTTANAALPKAGGTMTGALTIASTGTANSPTLAIDTSSNGTYVHAQENFAANLVSGNTNVIVVGKEGSAKNSGYIGYYWDSNGSNNNYVSIGHWAANHLFRIYGDGTLKAGASNVIFHDGYHPNADKWTTARTLSLSGDASGSVSWDGSANATLSVTVANDSHSHSNYITSNANDTASGSYSFTNSYNEFGNSTGSVSNDGNWNARVNLAGSSHARLDVKSVSDGIITTMYSHTGHNAGKVGTYSNHPLKLMVNAADRATLSTSGSLSTTAQGTLWGASNDGSGSGLDADLLDGVQGSHYLNYNNLTNTPTIPSAANNATITLSAGTGLSGGGDFTTNQSTNETITFNLEAPYTYIDTATGNYGTVKVDDDRSVTWAGYAIRDDWVFMSNGAAEAGIYNDTDNEWGIKFFQNGNTVLYNNGVARVTIGNSYTEMAHNLDMNDWDIYGVDQIFHHNDTNTYMQFHAADQWRVVVGGTERLEVKNSSPHVLVTGDLNSTSDARLKENVEPIANALSDIAQLEGVSFDWKDTGTRGHGFIAQQVEPILPDVVQTDDETGMKSINYVGMIGHLVEAIKELKAEIEELKR